MKALVLAGGLGSRLRERVPELPKPMAQVAGRPFLEYLLDRLITAGIRQIILSIGYRAEAITAHFGTRYREAAIDYAIESEPLGTGGAIAYALRESPGDEPWLVVNGDTLLNLDYAELCRWYAAEPSTVAMVLKKVPDTARYGSVLLAGQRVRGFLEKGPSGPGLVNAGIYIVQPKVFEVFGLAGKFSFETALLQQHCAALSPRAWVTDAYFIDIGVPEDYDRAQHELPEL